MSATAGQCHATVVLLCLGRGGDPNSYRPKRDESQWWSRRDALVRCVASFLFGPSPLLSATTKPQKMGGTSSKDMILIFDDDGACMYLSLDDDTGVTATTARTIPTEQTILSVFKQAAQSLNVEIARDGLKCRIVMEPTSTSWKGRNEHSKSSPSELPTGLDSKRQVLEYLQKHCSIDFLRSNGLNSNPTVILRKTNKQALMEIWNKWRQQQQQQVDRQKFNAGDLSEGNGRASSIHQRRKITESLFLGIIKKSKETGNSSDTTTIVGTLHESCEEFPCFRETEDMETTEKNLRIVMFLGAVRDMTSQENQILQQVCKRLEVPYVGVRFGTVAEFTSKILTVLAFHHSHPRTLRGALMRLVTTNSKWRDPAGQLAPLRPATCLHVICTVPLRSEDISLDLVQRDRIHWCIVRVVVCTLWRSRLVSSDSSSKVAHVNTLIFLFDDGVILDLSEETFVSKLASQHQAAPSEYQILAAIRALLESKSSPPREWTKKSVASQVVDHIVKLSPQPLQSTISISPGGDSKVTAQFFSGDGRTRNLLTTVMAVLDIQREGFFVANSKPQKARKLHRAILAASEKLNVPVFAESIVSSGVDYEAAAITCLQHFLYQNRLFSVHPAALSGNKRKKSSR